MSHNPSTSTANQFNNEGRKYKYIFTNELGDKMIKLQKSMYILRIYIQDLGWAEFVSCSSYWTEFCTVHYMRFILLEQFR
jgi:hypothetical protein